MSSSDNEGEEAARRAVPEDVPSITAIRRAIPTHCFRPSALTSMYFVAKDLILVAVLYVCFVWAEETLPTHIVTFTLTPAYWFMQGTMFWALFVLGHDCGHGSFSGSSLLNDTVGNLLHSAVLLVPYYPWKLSHRHHHKNTGNIDREEIFYPVRERDAKGRRRLKVPYFGLGLGWFYYLALGYSPRPVSHFNPAEPLFARHSPECAVSLACCCAWVAFALVPYASHFGVHKFFVHYLVPLFVFASWLVVTTFLHHQDENVPWYADSRWDFVRGNLSSVDRDYGWAHGLTHHIGTHQVHHLFSRIPHYRLEEATAAFRSAFPHLVRKSDENVVAAFVRMSAVFDRQKWVRDDTQVHVYRADKIDRT